MKIYLDKILYAGKDSTANFKAPQSEVYHYMSRYGSADHLIFQVNNIEPKTH